jgi:DNA-binding YbaB/EbfC family protein
MSSFNLQEMLQRARQMQEQLQRQLTDLRVEASAGGGMVTVAMNGQKQVLRIHIDPSLIAGGDVEMIQELVMGAVNQASRQIDQQFQQKLGSLAGNLGMSLPGIGNPNP